MAGPECGSWPATLPAEWYASRLAEKGAADKEAMAEARGVVDHFGWTEFRQ